MKKKFTIFIIILIILGILAAIFIFMNKGTKMHVVSFDTEGGTSVGSIKVENGQIIFPPQDPVKDGYIFIGWELDGKTYDFSQEITEDIVIKAIWEKAKSDVETFVVKFDSDGGSTVVNQVVEKGSNVKKPEDPTKDGYIFLGWYLNSKEYDFNSKVTKNITLKAKWEKTEEKKPTNTDSNTTNTDTSKNENKTNPQPETPQHFVVTFDSDGGSLVNSQIITSGKTVTKPEDPTKDGYVFSGWTLNGNVYNFSSKVSSNMVLKATWKVSDNDALNLSNALNSLSNINITKGGQALSASYSGCSITLNPSNSGQITRSTSDTMIDITASVTCGNKVGNKTIKGIIKASTLNYTATPNDNQTNYIVKVYDGQTEKTGYSLYNMAYSNVGNYESYGYAAVNNADISGYPNFYLRFTNDANTIYVVSRR